jgi:hypothetical protein
VTGSLKEALALAAVAFVDWEKKNEKAREWGCYYINDNCDDSYFPEPRVWFFGRALTISTITTYAAVLNGPLAPLAQSVFELLDDTGDYAADWGGINTYPQAVELLQSRIEFEFNAQKDHPIGQPSTADEIRRIERKRVIQSVGQLVFKRLKNRRGLARMFRLRAREWQSILKEVSRGPA